MVAKKSSKPQNLTTDNLDDADCMEQRIPRNTRLRTASDAAGTNHAEGKRTIFGRRFHLFLFRACLAVAFGSP